MHPKEKGFVSLFLVFCLVLLSVNLNAEERRGANLIITKKEGGLIGGELITVKPDSLLLQDAVGKDVSVDIKEIKSIVIKNISKAGNGALFGLGIGAAGGTIVGYLASSEASRDERLVYTLIGTGLVGLGGLILGAIHGAILRGDQTIDFEGMYSPKIQSILDKLRKKARIRNFQ